MAKNFVVIADPGLTVSLTIENAVTGEFWNGSAYQVGETTVPMTEGAGYSGEYSEYYSATAPTGHHYYKALDAADAWLGNGQGGLVATAASVWAYVLSELAVDGDPGATPTAAGAIMLQYMKGRNEFVQTGAEQRIKNDAGATILEKTTTDDGSGYTRGKVRNPT